MTGLARQVGIAMLVLALVTAGCQAPTAENPTVDGSATPSGGPDGEPPANDSKAPTTNMTTPPPDIAVQNGSLRVDPGVVFQRVQALRGTDVAPPARVRVFETSTQLSNRTGGTSAEVPRFYRLAGLDAGPVDSSDLEVVKNGYVAASGEVGIYVGENATVTDERMLLAHEFTHYVQTQNDRRGDLGRAIGITTTESNLLRRAVVEGGAIVTADAYLRAHDESDRLNSEWYPEIQAAYPAGHVGRLLNGRYVHGHAYLAQRVDSPAGLPAVYENPPQTTEQLLHGVAPEAEPPTPLSVDAQSGEEWLPAGTDQFGELFLRYALEGGIGPDRAARAAEGWGNDTLVYYRSTERSATGYVWVLDWDDTENNSEFRAAMNDALDARGTRTDGAWALTDASGSARIVDIDEETTAVVFGPAKFVERATLSVNENEVSVDIESAARGREPRQRRVGPDGPGSSATQSAPA
jgi:hypothetical protein